MMIHVLTTVVVMTTGPMRNDLMADQVVDDLGQGLHFGFHQPHLHRLNIRAQGVSVYVAVSERMPARAPITNSGPKRSATNSATIEMAIRMSDRRYRLIGRRRGRSPRLAGAAE